MGSNVRKQGLSVQQLLQWYPAGVSCHDAFYVEGVLENILGHLSEGDRVQFCSRVCKWWHTAAVYVTVGRGVVSATASDALLLWLCRHGTGLRSLNVRGGSLCRDQGYSSIAGLHQLTRLELKDMTESPKLLSAIGSCIKDLVHLRLENVNMESDDLAINLSVAASTLWAGCSRLTYLQAQGRGFDTAFAGTFWGSLPHLKTLDLSDNPSHLDASSVFSNSSGSSDGCLLQLESLRMKGLRLTRPNVLGALTMLTSLNMADVAVSNPGNMLVVLPQLLQLQDLDIRRWHGQGFTVAGLQDALMPLTQLTALALSNTSYVYDRAALNLEADGQPGPAGGLFAGLYLPKLQVLDAKEVQWSDGRKRWDTPLCGQRGNLLQAVTAAAPAMRCLCIKGSISRESGNSSVWRLSTLAYLTSLEMTACQYWHDWEMHCLSKLSTLSSLTIAEVGRFITDRGILGLSALSALSHLQLTGVLSNSVSLELLPGRGVHTATEFKLQNKMGQRGRLVATVAQQLMGLSLRSPHMQQEALNKALQAAKGEADKAQDKVLELQGLLDRLQERLERPLAVQEPLAG